ncbi:MAG: AraC family transcriptional regulator [Pseudomonadota bacterium]
MTTTTHAGIGRMMVRALATYGVDGAALLEDAGLVVPESGAADERLRSVAMQQVWRRAVEVTGDEAFGITFAEQLHPASLLGLGFTCSVSNTLRDAFARLVRYYRVIASAGEVVLEDADDGLRLAYRIPGARGAAAPASLDAALALYVQLARLTQAGELAPARVELQREAPNDAIRFDAFFRCPIRYDQEENALIFDRESLERPLPMANPDLARASDQVIIDYLRRHEVGDTLGQVRAAIIDWLPAGAPSQAAIAKALNTSSRTLQRKLSASGVTFSGLLEDVRCELAQQYLGAPGRSVSDVAYLLGFSEPGNFSRSFKRWTGQTPVAFQSGG